MNSESYLRAKIRRIQTVYADTTALGERNNSGAPLEGQQAISSGQGSREQQTEIRFSVGEGWTRTIFDALCSRYGLVPCRTKGQHRTTVVLRVAPGFANEVLWPQCNQLVAAVKAYLEAEADRIIQEEIIKDHESGSTE